MIALRWIATLPAAIAAYFGLMIGMVLLTELLGILDPETGEYGPYFAAAWAGWGGVTAGAFVAPNYRRETSIVLATILCVLMLSNIATSWGRFDYMLCYSITAIAAVVASVMVAQKDSHEKSRLASEEAERLDG